MSSISGQDGLRISVSAEEISADTVRWETDAGRYLDSDRIMYTAPGVGRSDMTAGLILESVSFTPVNIDGSLRPGEATLTTQFDVGSGPDGPRLAFEMNVDRVRFMADRISHDAQPDKSYGSLALDFSGQLSFSNSNGIFNDDGNVSLNASVDNAAMFYRQLWHEHPYLVYANMNALWEVIEGSIGIGARRNAPPGAIMADVAGIRTAADFINVRLDNNILYKFPVGLGEDSFTITGQERELMHFGWEGTLRDAELVFRPGGIEYANGRSDGLNFSSRWNYAVSSDTDLPAGASPFRWRFGEVGGPGGYPVRFELSDWVNLPGIEYGHDFPYIGIDVINAGQGAAPLCWGAPQGGACAAGSLVGLQAGQVNDFITPTSNMGGVALSVRDGNLLTYAERVRLFDGSDPSLPFNAGNGYNREFDWGLIYTLANVDGDIYFYPGGNPSDIAGGSLDYGIIADIALMSQTFNGAQQGFDWSRGSHLMIADTDAQMGIGLLGVSFLLLADDTRIWIKPQWNPADHYEGGLDIMSRNTRLAINALFGGTDLTQPESRLLQGALIGFNYEGLLNIRLSPAPLGEHFLGYSMAMRAYRDDSSERLASGLASGEGTYLSFAEPSRPTVEMRLADITGDMAIVNGRIDLRGADEDGDGFPKLVISQDILIGQTAHARMLDSVVGSSLPGGSGAQVLQIGAVEFAGNSLGTIVVPSGQWHTSITLRPQDAHPSFP
ncbi:hypothetical protein K8B33_02370 [Alcanivorax sp. JB21]|nr:hypothetical protein [Alcanivorax limicola]MBZ2187930.1 hypothetical protein [Alcanivorax limicola]